MTFHIITLFPDAFSSYLNESIIARAIREKKIAVKFYNPRDFVTKAERKGKDKNYARVDNKPFGGGPGMVMEALPVLRALEKAFHTIYRMKSKKLNAKRSTLHAAKVIFLSPAGKQFTTETGKKMAKKFTDVIIISGRYEGIDERVNKIYKTEKISVGPYVTTGGELPAMILIDSISRQVEGVLGNFSSLEESRVSSPEVYTRPEVLKWKGKNYRVPKVLLSGNHKNIEAWKTQR